MVFRYPAYLGRKNETLYQEGLDIEAPPTPWWNCGCGFPRRWPRAIWNRPASNLPAV